MKIKKYTTEYEYFKEEKSDAVNNLLIFFFLIEFFSCGFMLGVVRFDTDMRLEEEKSQTIVSYYMTETSSRLYFYNTFNILILLGYSQEVRHQTLTL